MAKLPQSPDSQTVAAIYAARKAAEELRFSRRLGASQAGKPCDRALWYSFRWYAEPEKFNGRMVRLFAVGDLFEERIAQDLHAAGIEVSMLDPETMKQFEFTGCDGHLVAKIDGACLGVPEDPKTWHVLGCKTMNAKNFAKLLKDGVRGSKPEHYVQAIIELELTEQKRYLYIAENKDDSALYTERFRYEEVKEDAKACIERCQRIINATEPPERISYDIDSWECKYCSFKEVCHSGATPATNCRTCEFSRPISEGQWHCSQHSTTLTHEQQLAACNLHQIQIGVPAALKKTPAKRSTGATT